jgi:uncharacterized membrane protein YfcA
VSNTIGLVPGSVAYRRELEGQRTRMLRFAAASAVGGITGAVLLLVLPESAFDAIAPVFIGIALVSIVLQPRLDRLVAEHRPGPEAHGTGLPQPKASRTGKVISVPLPTRVLIAPAAMPAAAMAAISAAPTGRRS